MTERDPLPEWPLFGMTDDVRPTLRQLRDAAQACTLATLIEVDGGIDPETAPLAVNAGANVLVAGTAVFRGGPFAYADNIRTLRGDG